MTIVAELKQSLSRQMLASFGRVRRDEDGVAAVEFALIVPIMMFIFIGAVEISTAISVDRRMSQSSATVTDLVARKETKVAFAEMTDYFKIGSFIMKPYDQPPLKMTVSGITADTQPTPVTTEKWRCIYDGSLAPNPGDVLPAPTCTCQSNIVTLAKPGLIAGGGGLVQANTTYNYKPLIFSYFMKRGHTTNGDGSFTLSETSYQTPRGQQATLTLSSGSDCPL